MSAPVLYIKSATRASSLGIGDGTIYASGSSAAVTQADKTFDLTAITKIDDLPTLAADDLNGSFLYFPASGNKYHIVDFVASTEIVTTWEVPQTTDTGAWEIRRALMDDQALAGNPTHRLSDGQKFSKWKSGANSIIEIHLENAVTDGGFESGGLSHWVKSSVGGTADTTAINTTAPILGKKDLKVARGDRTSVSLFQSLRSLYKNRTYRVLFKARHTGTFVADQFNVQFSGTGLDVTLSNPSSGSASGVTFAPTLTGSNDWHYADVSTPSWDLINPGFGMNIFGSFDVFIDEIYIHEIIDVNSMVLFDHTSPFSLTSVTGRNVARSRTGQTASVDHFQIAATETVTGGDATVVEFELGFGEGGFGEGFFGEVTEGGGIFPIYTIEAADLIQASEILLCERWEWQHGPNRPVDFDSVEYDEKSHQSRSGVERTIRHHQRRTFANTYPSMPEADRLILINAWKPYHRDDLHPFAIKMRANDPPILMIEDGSKFSNPYQNIQPDWAFKFKEVL